MDKSARLDAESGKNEPKRTAIIHNDDVDDFFLYSNLNRQHICSSDCRLLLHLTHSIGNVLNMISFSNRNPAESNGLDDSIELPSGNSKVLYFSFKTWSLSVRLELREKQDKLFPFCLSFSSSLAVRRRPTSLSHAYIDGPRR